jgi:Leucine-rich repeat (LRR) protein
MARTAAEAYLEAERNIEAALRERSKELDLSGWPERLKLIEVPESLGQLTQLQSLDLAENQLTALPESLGQLTLLDRLDLSENRLTTLPESLGQLGALKQLFLHENPVLGLSADILGPTFNGVRVGRKPADPRAILAFYFGQRKRSAKPLNEVKRTIRSRSSSATRTRTSGPCGS